MTTSLRPHAVPAAYVVANVLPNDDDGRALIVGAFEGVSPQMRRHALLVLAKCADDLASYQVLVYRLLAHYSDVRDDESREQLWATLRDCTRDAQLLTEDFHNGDAFSDDLDHGCSVAEADDLIDQFEADATDALDKLVAVIKIVHLPGGHHG